MAKYLSIPAIAIQLILLYFLVDKYDVESSLGLGTFLPYILGGFLIHAFLPLKHRLPFFILLSVGAAFYLFNWIPALVLLAFIAILFGILQLPFSTRARGTLLLAAGGSLAATWVYAPGVIPESYKIVPIAGSIFMFRASLYLYEVKHEKKPAPFTQRLAYFLLLPNFVFTLFPVVDYKLFQRNYYNHPELEIYQKGVRWMVRGFFHLMLYRIIYYFVQPGMEQADTLAMVLFYSATSYALILRLSGLFHFSTGILCLFGFNLPPVFHNYFFASDFSDLWRRINIYWRDYVMKVFYYPIYFNLRKLGKYSRTIVSILIVFVISWMLHSYQWFWLKGSFPIRAVDAIYWGLFGVLVAGNAVYQQAVPKNKRLIYQKPQWAKTAVRSLKIITLLTFMSFFWAFWSAPSVSDYWHFMGPVRDAAFAEWIQVGTVLLGLFIALFVGQFLFDKNPKLQAFLEPDEEKSLSIFWSLGSLSLFAILCIPSVLNTFQKFTEKPIEHIYETRLSAADDAMMIRGYYEDILIANQLTTPLTDMRQAPEEWVNFSKLTAVEKRWDWMQNDILPNKSTTFKGAKFTTNEWGMRDRSYPKMKEPNHFRIGVLGGSYVLGSGVSDNEVFDNICEDQFNQDNPFGVKLELLNFSLANYHLLHQAKKFEAEAINFDIDAVMFVTQGLDFSKAASVAMENLKQNYEIGFDFVMETMAEEGYILGSDHVLDQKTLRKLNIQLVEQCYQHISQVCQANNITPILLYWPRTRVIPDNGNLGQIFKIAQKNGFIIIDLSDVYNEYKMKDLIVASFDKHPNALAHLLVAEKLKQELIANSKVAELIRSVKE